MPKSNNWTTPPCCAACANSARFDRHDGDDAVLPPARNGPRIKAELNVPVIVGGQHVPILAEQAFAECFDYFFLAKSERPASRFSQGAVAARGESASAPCPVF
jgi:hypothetical protein